MWYRIFPRRLDRQVALVCFGIMIFTIPLYVVHEAQEELSFIFDTAKRETKVIANNIAINSIEHIITRNYSSLENLLLQIAGFPDIIEIQVANEFGKILSDVVTTKKGSEDVQPRYSLINIKVPEKNSYKLIEYDEYMDIWAPIEAGKHIGWVKIKYSLLSAKNHRNEKIKNYLFDGTILSVFISLFLLLAMRHPLRMIKNAVDFSARLDNKSGEQLPVSHQSVEIEKLFIALNKTSLSLAAQEAMIKKGIKDLETQKHALDEHSIVMITDTDGNIKYANDKLLEMTHYKPEELLGKNSSILRGRYHTNKFYQDVKEAVSTGESWHGEIVCEDKYKNRHWMQTTIVPFLDENGCPYEYVTIQSDISAQKETEGLLEVNNTSLELLTKELEDKVESRTYELRKANEELSELNNIKSEFVSIVSHELRTPLTSIKSFAEILEDDFDELDSDTRNKYLSIINSESVRLGNLINDVLDLQKIDAGKTTWNIEAVDLKKLSATTIELFSRSYMDKGLSLNLKVSDDDLVADVDSDKIKQVLTNLLSNAYKFTEQGSVTLELKRVVQKPTVLVVDDDETCLVYFEMFLQGKGINVLSCDGAKKAIKILKNKNTHIDLLITDIVMPDMDGVELIKHIRQFAKKLPIVAISSNSNASVLKSLLDYNISSFLDKPFQAEMISKTLNKVLGDTKHMSGNQQMLQISVQDSGIGIPENELSNVFDRFHQVDNSETREKGGSGLGLAICKDIIEHHKGTLWVTSVVGKGSRFTFNLPLHN